MNRPNVQQDVGRLGFEWKPPTQVFSRLCSMPVCLACSFSASTPVSDWLHVHCFGMFSNMETTSMLRLPKPRTLTFIWLLTILKLRLSSTCYWSEHCTAQHPTGERGGGYQKPSSACLPGTWYISHFFYGPFYNISVKLLHILAFVRTSCGRCVRILCIPTKVLSFDKV